MNFKGRVIEQNGNRLLLELVELGSPPKNEAAEYSPMVGAPTFSEGAIVRVLARPRVLEG